MRSGGSNILIVASTVDLATRLEGALRAAGHQPIVVRTFAAAKRHLDHSPPPDLLMTEIKLREYNGLHLAVRGMAMGIPAIVVGDQAFERDAAQLGAVCVSPTVVDGAGLHEVIARLMNDTARVELPCGVVPHVLLN